LTIQRQHEAALTALTDASRSLDAPHHVQVSELENNRNPYWLLHTSEGCGTTEQGQPNKKPLRAIFQQSP